MLEITGWNGGRIKAFVDGVEFEQSAQQQVHNLAGLPFIHSHVAVMPDVHMGVGATVGSVFGTKGAIIPAAVGVDIGCGMCAVQTTLKASDLPDSLAKLRDAIERTIPVGFSDYGSRSGAPASVMARWRPLDAGFEAIHKKHPKITSSAKPLVQLGTLGGGNHFIEICLDTNQNVWLMLHSGSRGIGNKIGTYFIERAKEALAVRGYGVPDKDLAWLDEGSDAFNDYVEAMLWAQDYAAENRKAMLERVLKVMHDQLPPFSMVAHAVNCHHNFAEREEHFGETVWVTRKGAVRARKGELGIIPGSMGAKSFIVRGLGNPDSFQSCSHGAGRRMSRSKAKELYLDPEAFAVDKKTRWDKSATQTVDLTPNKHMIEATKGVECRKDNSVVDEIPAAYKDIDAVMNAQSDLVEIVATLKQVLCVKG